MAKNQVSFVAFVLRLLHQHHCWLPLLLLLAQLDEYLITYSKLYIQANVIKRY